MFNQSSLRTQITGDTYLMGDDSEFAEDYDDIENAERQQRGHQQEQQQNDEGIGHLCTPACLSALPSENGKCGTAGEVDCEYHHTNGFHSSLRHRHSPQETISDSLIHLEGTISPSKEEDGTLNPKRSSSGKVSPIPGPGEVTLTSFKHISDDQNTEGKNHNGVDDHSSSSSSSEAKTSLKSMRKRWAKFQEFCGALVNHPYTQSFVVLLIIINAGLSGVASTDYVTNNPVITQKFADTDTAFLAFFTLELSLQLIYLGHRLFLDSWLLFDFVIISSSWALTNFRIIRTFRIFRAFRLVSRLEILRNLVTAVCQVMPRMTAITALLTLILYIYAVLCTGLFQDMFELKLTTADYFSRLDISIFTLFCMMTLCDWSTISREVMAVYPWAVGIFLTFISLSSFIVYNLIIAVVCDAVSYVEGQSKQHDGHSEEEREEGGPSGELVHETSGCDCKDGLEPTLSSQQQTERIHEMKCQLDEMILVQRTVLDAVMKAIQNLEESSGVCSDAMPRFSPLNPTEVSPKRTKKMGILNQKTNMDNPTMTRQQSQRVR